MNKAEMELWSQQPETKWLIKELRQMMLNSLTEPCLDSDNPYKTHAARAWNEGRAQAFEEVISLAKGED